MCVKNQEVEEIGRHVDYLRSTVGRKASKPLPGPVITRLQSVQGMWDPSVPMQRIDFTLKHE